LSAVSATFLIKKWVDSENAEVLEAVRQREGCAHIEMVEGSPPTPVACAYVHDKGGIAWKISESACFFWHPETTFKPLIFTEAFIPDHGV
jgi:hypothetical protein